MALDLRVSRVRGSHRLDRDDSLCSGPLGCDIMGKSLKAGLCRGCCKGFRCRWSMRGRLLESAGWDRGCQTPRCLAEVGTIWRHRGGKVADLAQAEAVAGD